MKFDTFLPLYNWIYPVGGVPSSKFSGPYASRVLHELQMPKSRALYVHIPFCDTICSFCPFVRAADHSPDEVDRYVSALVREIAIKSRIPEIGGAHIGAVFFGGGTPSVLSPDQIRRIGGALHSAFNLDGCREFSFEFEAKTATNDRVTAARDIGVTHARFGAQTFVPAFREHFRLTASLEDVKRTAELLHTSFPSASCDVLYGMHGQTEEELEHDINVACSLGLANLDFYPINNLVTQPILSTSFRRDGRRPTSGLTKHYMSRYVRESLRERGYLPHNGHGFVRSVLSNTESPPLLTSEYSFVYHEHTLGYPGFDLLGFGVNAVSSFPRYVVSNTESRREYVASLLDSSTIPMSVTEHPAPVDACRALALALPYHGEIPVDWIDAAVPDEVRARLDQVEAHGLVHRTPESLALTEDGLAWYANLMFFLSPASERAALASVLHAATRDPRRSLEPSGLEGLDLRVRLPVSS